MDKMAKLIREFDRVFFLEKEKCYRKKVSALLSIHSVLDQTTTAL
jgi:hypothetical protein